ncbi:hypothetical protein [Chitinophaga sancti]|uniref:hypothetical protein n=1 Tax=Chitinophaga sancti TaxID=1004 RepID=UPI003F79D45B
MKKQEVELILIRISSGGQDALNMKIYKNGTTCRYGVGGVPQINISGMSFFNDARFFDPLLANVPDQVLEQPIMYEEPTPNGDLEYVIGFYGVSRNGETGEAADWSKSTGIRLKIDKQTKFNDSILSVTDTLTMLAIELTNDWYFDIMMQAGHNMLSSALPRETIISHPKTKAETSRDFQHYIDQMKASPRHWKLADYDKNKVYEREGRVFKGVVKETEQDFAIHFYPVKAASETKAENSAPAGTEGEQPWWKVW